MLVLHNTDVPGVIGKMGNVLGASGINIAGFHLGRVKEGGKAVAIINVDSAPTDENIQTLLDVSGILNVNTITL